MKLKKALLFNPPSGNYIRDDRCQVPADAISSSLRAPIDLLYYATILGQGGVACRLVDYPAEGLGRERFLMDLEDLDPDIVVASITTPTLEEDMACLADAKRRRPGVVTVAKGAHLVISDEEVMRIYPQLDIAIRNEAEMAMSELVRGKPLKDILGISFRSGADIRRNPDRPQVMDLDWLPFPDRRLLNNSLYVRPDTGEKQTTILVSRGCPKSCIFCLVKVVSGRPISQRSPASIVSEVEKCVRECGIRNFYFRADTFTWYKEWVSEICDLILEKRLKINWVCNSRADTVDDDLMAKMRSAGCWMIGLGIESGSPDILKKILKGITLDQARRAAAIIRRNGLKFYNFFILGFPWDDARTIRETVDFAIELDSDFVEFHTAYPFPGTELHEVALRDGLFEAGSIHGKDVMTSPMRTRYLSSVQVHDLRRRALLRYYLRPAYVWRTIRHIDSPRVLLNYVIKGSKLFLSLL